MNLTLEKKQQLENIAYVTIGNILAAGAINLIITPMHLYNGGFTGIAQIIRTLLVDIIGVPAIPGVDYLGIVYYAINVPLFILGYKVLGKRYCITSMFSIGELSLAMSLIPVATEPLFNNYLAACLVGGVIAGIGAGFVMRGGTSGGGQDIIGMAMAKLKPNAKVGTVGIIINFFVYLACFLIYDIEIVIYSFIYSTIINLAIDRVFVQNINMQAMIFTKKEGISNLIMTELKRGVTRWEGEGAYTNETTHVLVVMISKYERGRLLELVHSVDPNAFVMINEGTSVYGNFSKRLTSEENIHPKY